MQPITLNQFVQNIEEANVYSTTDTIIPKHYRLIINPILNDSQNQFSFSGNVWITITSNDDDMKTIELDVKDLDIRAEDVSVYRSRILSDLNFQLESDRGKRLAKLIERDVSAEEDQFDMLMNSTELIDSYVTTGVEKEKESQEIGDEIDENSEITTEVTETQSVEGTEFVEESSEPSTTEYIDYDNVTTIWEGLFQNDSLLVEPNPDDQTELQIDSILFNAERRKLKITLNSALRKGHYYIVKVFFSGNMSNDYGLVYKSYDGAESNDKFS